MTENFSKAFNLLLELEGFESNLKNDIGGKTIYGITETFFPDTYKKIKELVQQNKFNEAKKIAREFYFNEFWIEYRCYEFPDKIDILYFCTAVNTPKGVKFIAVKTDDFISECMDAIDYYVNQTSSEYKVGLVNRVLKIWKTLK